MLEPIRFQTAALRLFLEDCSLTLAMHTYSTLSFFWRHIRPYKWLYLVMMCAPFVSAFYTFAYNYAVKLFLDTVTTPGALTWRMLLVPIVFFLSFHLFMETIWRISSIAEWRAEPFVRRSILLQSYDYVQHHAYPFFQDNFTGAISSKIKGLLSGYDKFWAEMHHGLLHRILKSVVNLGALFFINGQLGLFMFLWSALYVPIMYKLSLTLNHLAFEESESQHVLIGQISDKISNILSLLSFATRKEEIRSLDSQISYDFIPKQLRLYKYDFKIQIIGALLYLFMFGFLFFFVAHLRMTGAISIGDFAFVFGMTLSLTDEMWHTTHALQDFSRSMGDFKSALSILNIPHQSPDKPDAKPLLLEDASITFQDVCFTYNQNKKNNLVFDGLNLRLKPGEKVGLVGHSGAGKSSLVNLLLRYFAQDCGQILVGGQDIAHVTQDSLRAQIAVIPQDTLLFHRTLMENIRYGKVGASDEEVIEASQKAHVHEFIMTLPEGYNTYVGERGIKLSGGQRQRIAIARAILKDAPILVLDEATSSLDSQTENLIQESLNFLIGDKKKTVIAIAHRLPTLKHMNRIIVLDKGHIVEEGTHDTLIQNPQSLYTKLWALQAI